MQVTAFVDWGNDENEVAILVGDAARARTLRINNNADGLATLRRTLTEIGQGEVGEIRVGLERGDGLVVDALLDAGFLVYSINPKQIERFRTFLCPSGAKDDRLDASAGARALRSHPEAFSLLREQDPRIVELRDCARLHVELVKEETQLTNQIREQLLRFYPEFVALGSFNKRWVRATYALAPTPEAARRLTEEQLAPALKGSRQVAANVLARLHGPRVTVAPGVTEGAAFRAQSGLRRLEQVLAEDVACQKRSNQLLNELATATATEPTNATTTTAPKVTHSDIAIIRSMPGFGDVVVPALVAWGWTQLEARDAEQLARRCGTRPVSVQTGKRQNRFNPRAASNVRMRFACNQNLRNMMHHAGATAAQHDAFYKAMYAACRARGHSHGRACRHVADHLLRVLVACLKAGQVYDSARLLANVPPERPLLTAEGG